MSFTEEEIREFMDSPRQMQAEVIVAHRIGYWMITDPDDVSPEEIEQADIYLNRYLDHIRAEAYDRGSNDLRETLMRHVGEDGLVDQHIVAMKTTPNPYRS